METILAEKLETVISRSDQNTRPRDYYDIYILTKLYGDEIDPETLSIALSTTAKKRDSESIMKQYRRIMKIVGESKVMNQQWIN
jgi:predicted nucleotidyltransferase component of viral defense system